jgi:hypothetical protein
VSRALLAAVLLAGATVAAATEALDRTPLAATTASGEAVLLYPNGRWEFADGGKAEAARQKAAQYPENQVRPADAQGGLFGLGRQIMPGDKEYNRGSLNPKLR